MLSVEIIKAVGYQIEPDAQNMNRRELAVFKEILADLSAQEVELEKAKGLTLLIEQLSSTIVLCCDKDYKKQLQQRMLQLLDKV